MIPAARTARMRAMIADSGLSRREVADALGLTIHTVQLWYLTGPHARAPSETAFRLFETIYKASKNPAK